MLGQLVGLWITSVNVRPRDRQLEAEIMPRIHNRIARETVLIGRWLMIDLRKALTKYIKSLSFKDGMAS
jgi:hypothetical protein